MRNHSSGCDRSIILKDYGVKLQIVPAGGVVFFAPQFIHFLLMTFQIVEVNKPDFADLLALNMTLSQKEGNMPWRVAGLLNGLSNQDKVRHDACGIGCPICDIWLIMNKLLPDLHQYKGKIGET